MHTYRKKCVKAWERIYRERSNLEKDFHLSYFSIGKTMITSHQYILMMPRQNTEYITPNEAFNALKSNERRIKSMAIKQIVTNNRKLADLQTLDISLI